MRAASFLLLLVLVSGCGGSDCKPGWHQVFDKSQLDRPILALWGRGDEVYAVGGGVRDDRLDTLAWRWDGSAWHPLPADRKETLWWVWGTDDGRDVWMVGERGLAMRWDGARFTVLPKPTDATLFGVWGSGSDDVWLVGGTPGGGTREANDLVLHWDGRTLTPDPPPARGAAFFK